MLTLAVTSTTQEKLAVSKTYHSGLVLDIHQNFMTQLSGLVLEYIGINSALSRRVVTQFENRAIAALNESALQLKTQISYSVDAVVNEARTRAYLDAEKAISARKSLTEKQSILVGEVCDQILLRMKLAVAQASSLVREYAFRVGIYRSDGLTLTGSTIKAREKLKHKVGKYTALDATGRKYDLSKFESAFTLAVFSVIEHTTYIDESVELGYRKFRINQLGHRRHGMTFDAGTYPAKELHPRSEATVQLIKEV